MRKTPKNVKLKIIKKLIEKDELMTLSEIGRAIRESVQLTNYHLKELLNQGILVEQRDGEEIYYRLQEYYYIDEPINEIYSALIPLAQAIAQATEVEDDAEIMSSVINNLTYLLELFKEDLENILKEIV